MKIDTEQLKPCPFCGGEAEMHYWGKNGRILKCASCVVQWRQKVRSQSIEWLEKKLIENWNTRQPTLL